MVTCSRQFNIWPWSFNFLMFAAFCCLNLMQIFVWVFGLCWFYTDKWVVFPDFLSSLPFEPHLLNMIHRFVLLFILSAIPFCFLGSTCCLFNEFSWFICFFFFFRIVFIVVVLLFCCRHCFANVFDLCSSLLFIIVWLFLMHLFVHFVSCVSFRHFFAINVACLSFFVTAQITINKQMI